MLATLSAILPFHIYTSASPVNQKNSSPFDDFHSLEDLSQFLTGDKCEIHQWVEWKHEIRSFIEKYSQDAEEVDQFLTTITVWGIKKDAHAMTTLIVDLISFDVLNEIIRHRESSSDIPFKNILDWAAEHAELCPLPEEQTLETRFSSEWKKYRQVVIYFIPNLINIFLGAFNFLDIRKKYTTLWEKHLLLEIVYKFFVVPYAIHKLLQPFIQVTAKVYIATALVIAAVGTLLSVYQRWLRPIPDEIVNCTNLDKQMDGGLIDPKVGQAKELEKLVSALEGDANVLLIGRSGEGKTALVHHFIELKHAGKLSDKLQGLANFEVDCGLMISSVSFGYSELITQIKDQCDGYEDNVLLFFDEFYQIASNPQAFKAFKKRFLEDKPRPKFVATITYREFKEIQKLDIDGSFRRRVVPIIVESSDDDHNRLILRELIQRIAKDILVTDDAIEAAIEYSCKDDYLPEIGRPAKAIKIMTDAVGLCRSSFNPHYVLDEVSQARKEYQGMKMQAMQELKVPADLLKKIRQKKVDVDLLEEEMREYKEQAATIQKLIKIQRDLTQTYYKITHQLAGISAVPNKEEDTVLDEQAGPPPLKKAKHSEETMSNQSVESIDQEEKIRYLWFYFYAMDALKTIIKDESEKIREHLPIQVDADLIQQVYEDSRKIEANLFSDKKDDHADKKPELLKKKEIAAEKTEPLDIILDDLYE